VNRPLLAAWQRFEEAVVTDLRWRRLLIAVNLGGALYGFFWYAGQLAVTRPVFWPVVADSPLSALTFGLVLLLYTYGRRLRWLEALSYMVMIKYGLWAALVLTGYAVAYRNPTWETTHLTLSHLGMAVEAYIYLKRFHPGWRAGLVGLTWLVFNDFFDYTYRTHPYLPHPALFPAARALAYGLTLAVTVVYFGLARRRA